MAGNNKYKEYSDPEIMEYREILKIIADSARKRHTVEIYYPKTEQSPEGWREIEPYGLNTDIEERGEYLVYGKDIVSPGHILSAHTRGDQNKHLHSFIIGKIKRARKTKRSFDPGKEQKVRL